MTTWMFVGIALGMVAYVVAWTWGGRPERFAAGVLLFNCLLSSLIYTWEVGGVHVAGFIADCVRLLIFGWLCFRSTRWWLFVMTAAIALMVLVYVVILVEPGLLERDAFSGQVGLGYLVDLTLLLSPVERWLAGEPPAGAAAWAAADRPATARKNRRNAFRQPRARLRPLHREPQAGTRVRCTAEKG